MLMVVGWLSQLAWATAARMRWATHCGAHALGHLVGALRVGVGQDHRKFFAAHPRHDVDDPHAAAEHLGDGAQHLVPGVMAEAVIDLLEMVHVQHQQAQG